MAPLAFNLHDGHQYNILDHKSWSILLYQFQINGERSVYNLLGPCYTYNQSKEEASLVWQSGPQRLVQTTILVVHKLIYVLFLVSLDIISSLSVHELSCLGNEFFSRFFVRFSQVTLRKLGLSSRPQGGDQRNPNSLKVTYQKSYFQPLKILTYNV